MKTKHLILTLLALLMCRFTYAQSWTDSDGTTWFFEINGNNAELCRYCDSEDCYSCFDYWGSRPFHLTIPSQVYYNNQGYTVTSIGDNAFSDCSDLTSITIPNSVTSIGYGAFSDCSNLTSISIPNSVITIHSYAFYNCNGLTSVSIPNSVTYIGDGAFQGCSSLTSISIPNSVITIGYHAFQSCSGLTSVTIPNSVTTIGPSAFRDCSGLTSLILGSGVTSIGAFSFSGCDNLTQVEANMATPPTIDSDVFSNSSNATLYVPSSSKYQYLVKESWAAFKSIIGFNPSPSNCDFAQFGLSYNITSTSEKTISVAGLTATYDSYIANLVIPSQVTYNEDTYTVTSIASRAFLGHEIHDVTLPEGLVSIGVGAFARVPIYEVKIPTSVQEIGDGAFGGVWDACPDGDDYCWARYPYKYTVASGNQVYSSYYGILYNKAQTELLDVPCGYNEDVHFPSTLEEIPSKAFFERDNLKGKDLYLHNLSKYCQVNITGDISQSSSTYYYGSIFCKVAHIYYYVNNGSNIEELSGSFKIPSDVTGIGRGAFFGCKQITDVVFPSYGVTQINDYAFAASKITQVTLPATIQTIGQNAFYQQWDESIDTGETDEWGDPIYESQTWTMAMSSLIIPQSIQSIGSNAFNLTNGAIVTSKNNTPNNISSNAFKNASNCTLTVRQGLQSTYSQKTGWNAFGTISEDDNMIPYVDGEVFTATTTEGIEMTFKVLSATQKTVQVGDGKNPAIDNSFDGNLVVPSQINGLSVTQIGYRAFYQCQNLQSVTIQEGIVRTEDQIFSYAKIAQSITLPSTLTYIGWYSFSHSEIGHITIPQACTTLGKSAFYYATVDNVEIPYSDTPLAYGSEKIYGDNLTAFGHTNIGTFTVDRMFDTSSVPPFNYANIDELHVGPNGDVHWLLAYCEVTDYYPQVEEELVQGAFISLRATCQNLFLPEGYTRITSVPNGTQSISIPSTVTRIDQDAFADTYLHNVTVFIKDPLPITERTFYGNSYTNQRLTATLYVPAGSKAAYEAADYWKEFKEIVEMPPVVSVGSTGFATFCSPVDVDFSGVSGIKAYIASGFNPSTGTLVLTRVTEVPAGEGLYIVGDEGSYNVPITTTDMVYSNLLKGVTTATTISPTDGDYTNFILANGSHGVGFYTLSAAGELAGGKAYLQLPTASVASVKAISFEFNDGDETGISNVKDVPSIEGIYNLQGQRISQPRKGLNIINGKKVIIK